MANLFTRLFYGIPEAFYRLLRPFKAPLIMLLVVMPGMPGLGALFFASVYWITRDPRWMIVMILGIQNGSSSLIRLNGGTPHRVERPDMLRAASAHLTPFQANLMIGVQWWFQIDVWLGVIAILWLMWRSINSSKRES